MRTSLDAFVRSYNAIESQMEQGDESLKGFNRDVHVLCVTRAADGTERLGMVAKDAITGLTKAFSYVGLGPLAGKSLGESTVLDHIGRELYAKGKLSRRVSEVRKHTVPSATERSIAVLANFEAREFKQSSLATAFGCWRKVELIIADSTKKFHIGEEGDTISSSDDVKAPRVLKKCVYMFEHVARKSQLQLLALAFGEESGFISSAKTENDQVCRLETWEVGRPEKAQRPDQFRSQVYLNHTVTEIDL